MAKISYFNLLASSPTPFAVSSFSSYIRGPAVRFDVAIPSGSSGDAVDAVGVPGDVVARLSPAGPVARSPNINDRKGTEVL